MDIRLCEKQEPPQLCCDWGLRRNVLTWNLGIIHKKFFYFYCIFFYIISQIIIRLPIAIKYLYPLGYYMK